MQIKIASDIPQPVYVYYQLDNFYQNHRRYVKSRSNEQLQGEWKTVAELDDCNPITKNSDLGIDTAIDGTALDPDAPAFPCGLVAKSFFNDTFKLFQGDTEININDQDIAWKSDVDYKFANLP